MAKGHGACESVGFLEVAKSPHAGLPRLSENLRDRSGRALDKSADGQVTNAPALDAGAPSIRVLLRVPTAENRNPVDNRFGNWTSSASGVVPRNPNLPTLPAEPGAPKGIFTD